MRIFLAILVSLALTACATTGPPVGQRLDPQTGVTIRHVRTPLIFYRDNNARAAHARDFAYMAPITVNRSGEYNYFLWLGIWSSIDDRVAP